MITFTSNMFRTKQKEHEYYKNPETIEKTPEKAPSGETQQPGLTLGIKKTKFLEKDEFTPQPKTSGGDSHEGTQPSKLILKKPKEKSSLDEKIEREIERQKEIKRQSQTQCLVTGLPRDECDGCTHDSNPCPNCVAYAELLKN